VKEFLCRKRRWAEEVTLELERNRKALKDLLMMKPTLRKAWDWLISELNELAKDARMTILSGGRRTGTVVE